MPEQTDNKVMSSRAPKAVGKYPHARWVGEFLFLSGIGPRETNSDKIAGLVQGADGTILEYDFAAQCRSVLNNIRVIIEDAGARWEDIVDVTVFLINMKKDFATMNQIYAEHFTDNLPTRTTVEVNCLPTPIAIELKVICHVPGGRKL